MKRFIKQIKQSNGLVRWIAHARLQPTRPYLFHILNLNFININIL